MPRWKALPEELDPQIREFTGQLRRLVDRGGLSIATVADRTGYSKTSWERYLNGRLLAPRGAIVELAEVTGTNQAHLNTMWELAERAWSRAEMRHDMTMEAIRISQARAALDEAGTRRGHGSPRPSGAVGTAEGAGPGAAPGEGHSPSVPAQRGSLPRVPPQPGTGPDSAPVPGGPPDAAFAAAAAAAAAAGVGGPRPPAPGDGGRGTAGGTHRAAVIAAALVGVLLVVIGVVLLIG
ncbi:helix-turn-helix domain-containing protein [Streptomyces sp. NPDC002809]|uniref:helix-turn-helix domain-containing protein n=1 Tax=Streptomyces sp. NPDC002809 TaxID=3154433 RepID=UPI00331FBC33